MQGRQALTDTFLILMSVCSGEEGGGVVIGGVWGVETRKLGSCPAQRGRSAMSSPQDPRLYALPAVTVELSSQQLSKSNPLGKTYLGRWRAEE